MKILLFDIYITGHHSEYIDHLVTYLSEQKEKNNQYYFLVHTNFNEKFPDITKKVESNSNIKFICISEHELKSTISGKLIRQSFTHYKLLNKYATKLKIDSAILLYFNIFQFALSINRPKYNITGILFSQFTRQDNSQGIKEKLRYCKRFISTGLWSKNSKIKKVFILNDQKSCDYLNATFKTSIFTYLPDPIPELIITETIDIRAKYNIPIQNRIFLHFGSLSERKGTLDILASINEIPAEVQKGITIIIAGKPENLNTQKLIEYKIKKLSDNKTQIITEFGFVTNDLKNNMFIQCDVVLIPYKNVEASSGILNHAIAAGKPVVGPSKGLLGNLIWETKTGICLKPTLPPAIAISQVLKEFCPKEFKYEKINLEEFKPRTFSKIVIK